MSLSSDNLSTVEEFLENDAFRTWITHQRSEDRLLWQAWLKQHPNKRELYEQAVATLLVLQGKRMPVSDHHLRAKIVAILVQLTKGQMVVKSLFSGPWARWIAAATVVGLALNGQLGNFFPKPFTALNKQTAQPSIRDRSWKLVNNRTEQPLVVLLPDSSSVLLSSGSQLRFRRQNTNKRQEVYLKGEGFFEVSKNPVKPLIVYTANTTPKVPRTSFQVRSFAKEATTYVKVKTGNVSVRPINKPGQSVLLTTSEQRSLETKTDKVVKRANASRKQSAFALVNQLFMFGFVPVLPILAQLGFSYNMPIFHDWQRFRHGTFTGQLHDVPFPEKVKLICLTTESSFKVIDNQVLIESHSCD